MKKGIDQDRSISELIQEIRLANPYEFEPDSPTIPEKALHIIPNSYPSHQIILPESWTESGSSPESLSPIYPPASLISSSILTGDSSPRVVSQDSSESSYNWRRLEGSSDHIPKEGQNSTPHFSPSCGPIAEYYRNERNKKPNNSNNQYHSPYSFYHLGSPNSTRKDFGSGLSRNLNLVSMDDKVSFPEYICDNQASQLKRSRSTTKKIFGENGWLGVSSDEILAPLKRDSEKSSKLRDKTSLMEKLRNKIGEIAEKADLNLSTSFNLQKESLSTVTVSLGPPEQAEIYMEVELMIVYTANTFLMNNFSRGRMSIDSIKKIVDSWKNKGHPGILEFMYDQATQRDLVALNQHNFFFYGKQAKDGLKINSMLCNWKKIATLMAIRTFCNADTIIFRILFDAEQVLEFLGASNTVILRLQQIRNSALKLVKPISAKRSSVRY
ncbi:hypothetical protein OnM2_075015 [Erysiphe neolycopersici]|uniref:Uncharacterized protein n=1 Tax=Erysiphe neolycopersici TaxID=212602 RepID=A0A420HIL0_9PEZI|nr:hypothetical protein OnM2_075015 [Erysiphe neolycopersici]